LRTVSDVPVGVLLSGGLDSGSVAASLATQGHGDLASFTVRFDEAGYDEGPLAQQQASRWGFRHHELVIRRGEMLDRLRRASWHQDEPIAHASDLHLMAIAEFAKPRVSVLLSGEGADETLGGYIRYQPLRYARVLAAMRPWLAGLAGSRLAPPRARKLARFWNESTADALLLFNQSNVLPSDLTALGMPPEMQHSYREQQLATGRRLYPGEPMRQAMFVDQHTFLSSLMDRNDRMTMAASIECREPFLDYRLVEGLAAMPSSALLPGFQTKPLLRRAIGNRLPKPVRNGRKWGFGVPWHIYLRSEPQLRDLVASLPELAPIDSGPFDKVALRRTVDAFAAGDERYNALVMELVTIAVWHQECCAGVADRLAPGGLAAVQ
jgi:asparagine synthase (glutamine-hydrolysing)